MINEHLALFNENKGTDHVNLRKTEVQSTYILMCCEPLFNENGGTDHANLRKTGVQNTLLVSLKQEYRSRKPKKNRGTEHLYIDVMSPLI